MERRVLDPFALQPLDRRSARVRADLSDRLALPPGFLDALQRSYVLTFVAHLFVVYEPLVVYELREAGATPVGSDHVRHVTSAAVTRS